MYSKPSKLSLSKINDILIVSGREIPSPTPRWYTEQADKMNEEIKQIAISDAEAEQEVAQFICGKC